MSKQEHAFDFMLHTKLCDFSKGTGEIVTRTAQEVEAAQLKRTEFTEKALNEIGLSWAHTATLTDEESERYE